MATKKEEHIPVLLKEAIEALNIKKDGIYIDATLGRGGHSSEILKSLSNQGMLYAFDLDEEAIETSRSRLKTISPRYELIYSNYSFVKEELLKRGITKIDGILFDLGVSSPQFDNSERGFSYNSDAKLDMRMDQNQSLTAHTVVNTYSESSLREIIKNYGEERYATLIARNIAVSRKQQPINTTLELVSVIKKSFPASKLRETHPAKRTFQAIRIEVNKELISLEIALRKSIQLLNKGGRIAVITFHSLEDKIVKNIFKEVSEKEKWNKNMPLTITEKEPEFKVINKKVIVASEEELIKNRRSSSAKLRILEKK